MVLKEMIFMGEEMPFLHICDEKVFLFVAEVVETEERELEEGEFISKDIIWFPWDTFRYRVINQQQDGVPLYDGHPMKGVSLMAANRLLISWFEPAKKFGGEKERERERVKEEER